MDRKPWQKLSSKIIHKNPWYYLREDKVIRPDGKKGEYYYVDGLSPVAVIAEDDDSKIYLVGQTRYPIGNIYSWEIITGGTEEELSPIETAKQELQEEAGLIADEWTELGYFYTANGYSSERCHVYLARELNQTQSSPEPTEDITIRKENLEKIIKMINNNEITCAMTIAAIYKYLLYKERL